MNQHARTDLTRKIACFRFESPGPRTDRFFHESLRGLMSNNGPKPAWQELYEAACIETNREKLTDLIHRVEEALMQREQELGQSAHHAEERNAMVQASENLLVIKTEKLNWPRIEMK